MNWIEPLLDDPTLGTVARRVTDGVPTVCRGASGSSTTLVAATLNHLVKRSVLLVTAHLDDADETVDEFEALGIDAVRFPVLEIVPGETSVNLELLGERLHIVRQLEQDGPRGVTVAPITSLMQSVPSADRLAAMHRRIGIGDTLEQRELLAWLEHAGYHRVPAIDGPGDVAVRGGIVDVFPPGTGPVRIDFFGDDVDSICDIDLGTMGSDRRRDDIEIVGVALTPDQGDDNRLLIDLLPADTLVVLADTGEIIEQGRSYLDRVSNAEGIVPAQDVLKTIVRRMPGVIEVGRVAGGADDQTIDLPVQPLPPFAENSVDAVAELVELARGRRTFVLCLNDGELQRFEELLAQVPDHPPIVAQVQYMHRGFSWGVDGAGDAAFAFVPYHELLNRFQTRRRIRRVVGGRTLDAFLDLGPGDYVVHRDHGIARFIGLQSIDQGGDGPAEEFLTLEFQGHAKLHVPSSRIELVQKYLGAFQGQPQLSALGGKRWSKQKEKVEEAVTSLAEEMLQVQASREALPGTRYPDDTGWQREFEAEFPYEETEDQLQAIAAVKSDMMSPRPMDRLLCGDVGFGKTEVAIRAAFKAAEFGRQVAVLVPTTWLAEQHGRTFRERFRDYPFRVESLSRFRTPKEQKHILELLRKGQVDVVIGTHRLLSKDVKFNDLGLVVIDEEQRFGVEHKQRLLEVRATAEVLTMTATPIPRTLHMSMLGLRDISSLTSAPLDRRAIVTEVLTYDENRIRHGIARELAREGQVFFVHNRVHDIYEVADEVQRLAPEARIVVGHGQMPTRELEKVMRTFVRGDADILVSTTIIESGVDIPTTNTMFVDNADIFGLSELHQLRGRVGRHKHRAYCYLLLDPEKVINPDALKRLRALEAFSMLGAGFKIALRDLEIRGAGNLLGPEQSGHIAAVGYEMYCQLLEQAVATLKKQPKTAVADTIVNLGLTGTLPKGYIPSDARRMDAYRRIAQADTGEGLEQIRHDLVTAYGDLPRSAEHLIDLAEIRIAAARLGVRQLARHEQDIIFRTERPADLEARMQRAKGSLRLVGQVDAAGLSAVYYRPPPAYLEPDSLLAVLRRRLTGEPTPAAARVS